MADPKKNVPTMNAYVQNQQQQLKSWEQNSPSHMQMVQQQQPFSLQGDPDTKMLQITGFDHDRQQLATAMAGACHDDSCLMIHVLQSCKLNVSIGHATTSHICSTYEVHSGSSPRLSIFATLRSTVVQHLPTIPAAKVICKCMIGLKASAWRAAASVMCTLSFSCCTGNLAVRHSPGTAAGSMTLASNSLANNALTGVGSPRIVQVPNVSAVHALSLPPPTLSGSAATAVVAAVAQQELRQQQQQSQQVCLTPTSNLSAALLLHASH